MTLETEDPRRQRAVCAGLDQRHVSLSPSLLAQVLSIVIVNLIALSAPGAVAAFDCCTD